MGLCLYMLQHVGFVIQPILVRTYGISKTWWNTRPQAQRWQAHSKCKALTPLLTINPSWTSVKETPCEANNVYSDQLMWAARQITVVYSDQLLSAAHHITIDSNLEYEDSQSHCLWRLRSNCSNHSATMAGCAQEFENKKHINLNEGEVLYYKLWDQLDYREKLDFRSVM